MTSAFTSNLNDAEPCTCCMACQRPSQQCAGAANDVHARSLVPAGREQTCNDGRRCILVAELPGRSQACTASSCWPLATLCERRFSCVPTTWLQASIFVRQSVARIVSPEGRPASLSPTQAGVALGRVVCVGVPMDGPSGEGCVSVSGGGERPHHRRDRCRDSRLRIRSPRFQLPFSANRVPSSWAFSRRRAPQRPWGAG